jgi:hypothetical protein
MGSYWSKKTESTSFVELWDKLANEHNNYKLIQGNSNMFYYDQSTCFLITHDQTKDSILLIKHGSQYLVKIYEGYIMVENVPNFMTSIVSQLNIDNSFSIRSGSFKDSIPTLDNGTYYINQWI